MPGQDPALDGKIQLQHRGRDIPWLQVARFHEEIAKRAEQSFFSLRGDDSQDSRWTSLDDFDLTDLAGPWEIDSDQLRSQAFRLAYESGDHESLFLGGPCYLAWEKGGKSWYARWRPLFYREVQLNWTDGNLTIEPAEGAWSISPLVLHALENCEADTGSSFEELAGTIIERSARRVEAEGCDLSTAIVKTALEIAPDLEDVLGKPVRDRDFQTPPTSWVLFAPTNKFSAFTRNLIQDYRSLTSRLDEDETNVGGLEILEDASAEVEGTGITPLPVIPLDKAQEKAVRRILDGQPMTVISGPPGCGKSQVVVSVLLNAWASGLKVLFASNNNKAVDVVRERLERFESEIPVAVRAGSRKVNNVQEVLRRTLNLVAGQEEGGIAVDLESIRRKRLSLEGDRDELGGSLNSELPQRLNEGLTSSLVAYAKHCRIVEEGSQAKAVLVDGFSQLGLRHCTLEGVGQTLVDTDFWIRELAKSQAAVAEDNRKRQQIDAEMGRHAARRDAACARVGYAGMDGEEWRWLHSGPNPSLFGPWRERARTLLAGSIESDLRDLNWQVEFDRWKNPADARSDQADANALSNKIVHFCAESREELELIEQRRFQHGRQRLKAIKNGFPDDLEIDTDVLDS